MNDDMKKLLEIAKRRTEAARGRYERDIALESNTKGLSPARKVTWEARRMSLEADEKFLAQFSPEVANGNL